MKKATLTLGLISSLVFVIGVLLKWQHLPGAGIALMLSILLFVAGYSPLLFKERIHFAQGSHQKMINLASLITMVIIAVSFLFKVLHWPGAGIGVAVGNLTLILLVPLLFYRASKESDQKVKLNSYNEGILFIFLVGFSLFLWLILGRNP
jgi:O-antigen/teichoic acid export membrane protein